MDKLIERVRRHIEEVGECWEWSGAVQSTSPTPMMRVGRKTVAVRRALLEAQGKPLQDKMVTCRCRNALCVNPEHLMLVTRQRLQQLLARERTYHTNPLRMQKLATRARAHAKLNHDLVAEIREAVGPQREIAARYGVSQATVSAIKRGKTWRDYSNPFIQLFGGKK